MSASVSASSISSSLRESIRSGALAPGTVLRQAELAMAFGTSRIPVREALQALHGEGLVVIEPNRGAFVATFTAAQLDETFDLRVLLEGDALRVAVPRHDERTVRQLRALQRELDEERDPTEWIRRDRAFHEVLYAPSGRERTLALIAGLRAVTERFSLARLGPDVRRAGWNDEHAALIDAVAHRRPRVAVAVLERHLRQTHAVAHAALDASDGGR